MTKEAQGRKKIPMRQQISGDNPVWGIEPNGLVQINISHKHSDGRLGSVFGGDAIFVSKFQDGFPVGNSALVCVRERTVTIHADGSVGAAIAFTDESDLLRKLESLKCDDDDPEWSILEYIQANLSVCESDGWESLIEEKLRIRISATMDATYMAGSRCWVGWNEGEKVFLYPLPLYPPSGTSRIGHGLRVKESDIWRRRMERLFVITRFPQNVLRPIGFTELEGRWYFVSSFPEYVSVEDVCDMSGSNISSTEYMVQSVESIADIFEFVHSEGFSFNGFLNHRTFLISSDNEVWLNTAYVFGSTKDRMHVYGGFGELELRHLCPSMIGRLSPVLELISKSDKSVSAKSEDLFSLGALLNSLASSKRIPFHNIEVNEYIVSSMKYGVSFLETDELDEAKRSRPISLEEVSKLLICGRMQLEGLRRWIRYNLEVCDLIDSRSLGTEMKGILDTMASAFKSTPKLMPFQ